MYHWLLPFQSLYMNDSFWLVVNPAQSVESISASAWFFTVGVLTNVDAPPTCSVPLNCAFPALLIVATVVSVAPPDPITTPPVPELVDPFSTTAPVPAALITVWLFVLDCPLLYCPDRNPVYVIQQILNLIELFARGCIRVSFEPAVSKVGLNFIQQPRSFPLPVPRRK